MSASVLRRAASLMRERAEAAIHDNDGDTRWAVTRLSDGNASQVRTEGRGYIVVAAPVSTPDAEHVASWHPAVALEIASWLDHQAKRAEVAERFGDYDERLWQASLVIARAYLGDSA